MAVLHTALAFFGLLSNLTLTAKREGTINSSFLNIFFLIVEMLSSVARKNVIFHFQTVIFKAKSCVFVF